MASRLALDIGSPKIRAVAVRSAGSADHSTVTIENNCKNEFDFETPQINANHPPTIIIHGKIDPIVPFKMDELYSLALQNSGIKEKFLAKDNGLHM